MKGNIESGKCLKELETIKNAKRLKKELDNFNEMMEKLKKVKLIKKEYGLSFPYEHCVPIYSHH